MENKLLIMCCSILLLGLILFNIQIKSDIDYQYVNLSYYSQKAYADTETTGTCMGASYVNHRAKTGQTCFCTAINNFVTSQSCESGGTFGCTEISCN